MKSHKQENNAGNRKPDKRQGGVIVPETPRSCPQGGESSDGRKKSTQPRGGPFGGGWLGSRLGSGRSKVKAPGALNPPEGELSEDSHGSGSRPGPALVAPLVQKGKVYKEISVTPIRNANKKLMEKEEQDAIREKVRAELRQLEEKGESPFAKGEKTLVRSPGKESAYLTPQGNTKSPLGEEGKDTVLRAEPESTDLDAILTAPTQEHGSKVQKEKDESHPGWEETITNDVSLERQVIVHKRNDTTEERVATKEGEGEVRGSIDPATEIILIEDTMEEDTLGMLNAVMAGEVLSSTVIEANKPEQLNQDMDIDNSGQGKDWSQAAEESGLAGQSGDQGDCEPTQKMGREVPPEAVITDKGETPAVESNMYKRRERQESSSEAESTQSAKRHRIRSPRGNAALRDTVRSLQETVRKLIGENARLQKELRTATEREKNNEAYQPEGVEIPSMTRGDVDILKEIVQETEKLEELRNKCKRGLQGAIKGRMDDHTKDIKGKVDVLIKRYEKSSKSPKGIERTLQDLTRQNVKLQGEMTKLKREMKTMKWINSKKQGTTTTDDERIRNGKSKRPPYMMPKVMVQTESDSDARGNMCPVITSDEAVGIEITEHSANQERIGRNINEAGSASINLPAVQNAVDRRDDMIGRFAQPELFEALVRAVAEVLGVKRPPARKEPPVTYAAAVAGRGIRTGEDQLFKIPVTAGRAPRRDTASTSGRSPTRAQEGEKRSEKMEVDVQAHADTDNSRREGAWQTVEMRKRKRRDRNRMREPPQQFPKRMDRTARPLRTAAIVLKCSKELKYEEIMREMRSKISLPSLGIENISTRGARAGGIVIEIPRANDGKKKAAQLAEKMRELLPEGATVACPSRKVNVRIAGFDETITTTEIRSKLAEESSCAPEDIRLGKAIWNRGTGRAIAQMPLESAERIDGKKINIGWAAVRIGVIEPRAIQCFRCLEFGHLKTECTATMDRSDLCYRCGEKGHIASQCEAKPVCVICGPEVAQHRMGGTTCPKARARTGKGIAGSRKNFNQNGR